MVTHRRSQSQIVRKLERICVREDGSLRLAVTADTHSAPHSRTMDLLAAWRPDAILHAGDIGDLRILDELGTLCPVLAVRGNVDLRMPGLPDVIVVEVGAQDRLVVRILLLHVGVYGPKLRADTLRMAREEAASMVVCGHSHIPFIGRDRGITVFNPGSAGPRRFGLPIVFGQMDVNSKSIRLCHIDCETGLPWEPPGG